LAIIAALETQLDAELRRFARADKRCQALQSIYGIGPILACHLLAEIGEASRFRRGEQITPGRPGSGRRRVGRDPPARHLAKAGSPHLCWALVEAAVHANRRGAPEAAVYRATRARRDATVARLTVARKIGKRVYHALRDLELAAAGLDRLDALRVTPELGGRPGSPARDVD
jgi:transposase